MGFIKTGKERAWTHEIMVVDGDGSGGSGGGNYNMLIVGTFHILHERIEKERNKKLFKGLLTIITMFQFGIWSEWITIAYAFPIYKNDTGSTYSSLRNMIHIYIFYPCSFFSFVSSSSFCFMF